MEERTAISLVMAMLLGSVPPLAAFAQINQSNTTNTNSQQTTSVSEDDNNFLTYQNTTLGISIQYPSSWIKLEESGMGVMFISPPDENNYEGSSVMVNLQVLNLSLFSASPSDLSLQNYTNSTIEDLTAFNFSIIESNSTTLGIGNDNNTGHKLVFSMQDEEGGLTFQQMQIYTIRDSKLYQITYVGEAGKYAAYLPILEKMIDSFKIIDYQESRGMLVGR